MWCVLLTAVMNTWHTHKGTAPPQRTEALHPLVAKAPKTHNYLLVKVIDKRLHLTIKTEFGETRRSFTGPDKPDDSPAKREPTKESEVKALSQTAPGSLDFVKMNADGIRRGAITTQAVSHDRRSNSVRRRASSGVRSAERTVPKDMVFGTPSKCVSRVRRVCRLNPMDANTCRPSDHVPDVMVQRSASTPSIAARSPPSAEKPEKLTFGLTRATLLRQKVCATACVLLVLWWERGWHSTTWCNFLH